MKLLNEAIVMDYYLKLMKEDKIEFLIGDSKEKKEIKKAITKHIREIKKLKPEDIHEKIMLVRELWKILFEAAMVYIDTDRQGYDKLFEYFNAFVEFEELIFASDKYYRDHTLHSLWVYFLGEYLYFNPEFKDMFSRFNIRHRSYREINNFFSKLNNNDVFRDFLRVLDDVTEILKYSDSIRCVAALAHDLGYPLERIKKINLSIEKILPYFQITRFGAFSFQFDNVQQFYIENLLEIISCDIDFEITQGDLPFEEHNLISKTIDYIVNIRNFLMRFEQPPVEIVKEFEEHLAGLNTHEQHILQLMFRGSTRLTKDLSNVMRFGNDFESYRHGILSAYLIMKQLNSFANIQISYSDPNSLEYTGINIPKVFAKLRILVAMSDHKSYGFRMTGMNGYSDLLLLVDEIEEFSRISRANQYRQFINEFCKMKVGYEKGTLCVDFIFDDVTVAGLDPERNFIDRAKTFLKIFNIPELDDNLKIRIRCIDKLTDEGKTYEFLMSKNCFKLNIPKECFKPGTPKAKQTVSAYLKTKEVFDRCDLKTS